jgi:hypothetical protein
MRTKRAEGCQTNYLKFKGHKFGCQAAKVEVSAKHARADDEGRCLWLFGTTGLDSRREIRAHMISRFIWCIAQQQDSCRETAAELPNSVGTKSKEIMIPLLSGTKTGGVY